MNRTGKHLAGQFVDRFGASPVGMQPTSCWAPGRVNLIGDHVDYCGGPVLPMPIQFGTTVVVRLTDNGRVRAISTNVPDRIDYAFGSEAPDDSWGRLLWGAIAVLASENIEIRGVDVLVSGDIPGSGLSSSASLCVALIRALTTAAGCAASPLQLALAAQRVEHEYLGVQCGLMDQAVITLAVPGSALWFDCFDHRHRPIVFNAANVCMVVVDTGRTRQLLHSPYNERLNETRAAASALGVAHNALARIDPEVFSAHQELIDDLTIRRRARHVVYEAARVGRATQALEDGNWSELGDLLRDSHRSLRDDYEVSCTELDALVDALNSQPGCYGARMTGGGFGGNVVALIDAARVESATAEASTIYADNLGITPRWFVARSLGGARIVA